MVKVAGMATPAGGNVTTVAENGVFFIAIYYERVRAGMPFFEQNTFCLPSRDFLKASKVTESFEINC